ncbi:hypothetical protein BJ742DRAFT_668090, partial [Cladochytrium replicatum]
SIHACADGGANRLFDAFSSDFDRKRLVWLQIVKPSMESLRPDVAEWYKSQGVEVVDHDTTDFQKCLELVEEIEMLE